MTPLRAAFEKRHPLGDEVPGVLRKAFYRLYRDGWNDGQAAQPEAAAPLKPWPELPGQVVGFRSEVLNNVVKEYGKACAETVRSRSQQMRDAGYTPRKRESNLWVQLHGDEEPKEAVAELPPSDAQILELFRLHGSHIAAGQRRNFSEGEFLDIARALAALKGA